jgi:hypothetical protein
MSKSKSDAFVYEGVKSFMNVLNHFLDYDEPILCYGIPKNAPGMLKTVLPHFHKKRIEKKIVMKHIYNHNAQERANELNKMPYTEARYLPEKFDSSVSTNICGDEVVLVLWIDIPIVIQIKNKKIAEAYKNYFELLWDAAKF